MTRLSVFIASSIDGFIADEHGSLDWLEDAAAPAEDYGYDDFLADVDALAMGRGTYDHIAHLDPLPFGDRPVYVFTRRPCEPRDGVHFCSGTPQQALLSWRARGHRRVYVDGGQLIASFLRAGLIDDMLLTTAPVILGGGTPLFPATGRRTGFRLVDVRSWPSGMVNRYYERSDPPA